MPFSFNYCHTPTRRADTSIHQAPPPGHTESLPVAIPMNQETGAVVTIVDVIEVWAPNHAASLSLWARSSLNLGKPPPFYNRLLPVLLRLITW